MTADFSLELRPHGVIGAVQRSTESVPLPDAEWYTANAVGEGVEYRFPVGALVGANWLTADFLQDGWIAGIFQLELQEGDDGPKFGYSFALLAQAQARLRMPLEAVNQNRWLYDREGALLKPIVRDLRVDLRRVDRMRIVVRMAADEPIRWCMTAFKATAAEPPLLTDPLLPKGALLDEFGQNTLCEWTGKTKSAEELTTRLRSQLAEAPNQTWPEDWSQWGGWTGKKFDATGFFRVQWDDEANRWWLVDPDGCVFWSAGQDCVRAGIDTNYAGLEKALTWLPDAGSEYVGATESRWGGEYVDYLQANFIRAFGPDTWYTYWGTITLAELRRTRFNTVANWSDWEMAANAGFPYVRPLHFRGALRTPFIYRDLPDVFDPQFEADAAEFAKQLSSTRDDPAFIGYFIMNEPTWGFSSETPAAGMLFNTPSCATRRAFADFLRQRHANDGALSEAWEIETTFDKVAEGHWDTPLTPGANADLEAFSSIMVERYFGTLSRACKQVDPNHLNLGIRYHTVPPHWAQAGMRSFDVFSINCYRDRVPADELKAIHDLLNMPTMVGEWHHGALDVGLPAVGVGPRAATQEARGQAYRYYLETAAAIPWCVGVHHFTHYDQSALGRFDGENYNIGFYDVCNRPYEPMVAAAKTAHERMYAVALGQEAPFEDAPQWRSRFFF